MRFPWNNRELSVAEQGLITTIFVTLALLIAVCCSGCTTAQTHFYAGQGLDLATSYYALEVEDDFVESNKFLGDFEGVMIGKVVYAIFAETMVYLFPESADMIYGIGAFFGYGAGAWNIYQIGTK